MTSMPASRKARAITLAPRSWPSRPGFAINTRSFRPTPPTPSPQSLNDRYFLVLAPHLPQRVAHLAHRRVGADRIDDRRHDVLARPRRVAQPVERTLDEIAVARLLHA